MVKKWNEGKRFVGGMIDDKTGKVYLNLNINGAMVLIYRHGI